MANESLKLRPGVDQNETIALNEAGISISNLIRFSYDRKGLGLVQKLGGWLKYYPSQIPVPIRAMAAWEDTNASIHLAYGTQNSAGTSTLGVITNGANRTITPTASSDSVTPAASTTAGSSIVTITDTTTGGITSYDTVYIETHMSVGGLILYGLYPCIQVGATTYDIVALDPLGNPLPATSTTTTTTVASFTTTSGSNVASVTLANHGYLVGSTYPVLVATIVGGITFFGNYYVQSVTSSSVFVIQASTQATSSTTASINGGNAALLYSFGVGAVPLGTGYGIGGFGRGGFGTGSTVNPSLGTPISAADWTLDNLGQVLVSCPINGTIFQPIYVWDPTSGNTQASIIPQAPPVNDGIFVAMPQRQIVAWGSTATGIQDPLLLRWCDVSTYFVWIGTATNQAGQFRISRGSKIVGCMQAPQQALVWTDIDLWSMNYIGGELVYGFFEIGSGCGLISRKAMGAVGDSVYWMGVSQFFCLSGGGVAVLPCTVWDVIFQNLDTANVDKIRCAVNSLFSEITWYYPTTTSGGEVAAYVKFNVLMSVWDYGSLARSAWVDKSPAGFPVGSDPNLLYIYQHETSPDADGMAMLPSFQTGWAAMSEADELMFVDRVWPDMKWGYFGGAQNATVQITFLVANYPGDTPQTYGPYSVTQATQFIGPRLRGRLISLKIGSSDIGSFWRIGNIRYRNKPSGKN